MKSTEDANYLTFSIYCCLNTVPDGMNIKTISAQLKLALKPEHGNIHNIKLCRFDINRLLINLVDHVLLYLVRLGHYATCPS